MNESEGLGLKDLGRQAKSASHPHVRAVGSPLPMGGGGRTPQPGELDDPQRLRSVPPPGRVLTSSAGSAAAGQPATGFQRAVGALRMALPYVHRILPLLDGNIATSVSNLLAPKPAPPAPPVSLVHIEGSLADLHSQQRDLRGEVLEQNNSLKRVEDQLEMVREATDRNTLEQQELMEDLKAVGNKVNVFALFALGLLAVSVLLNLILYLHLKRVLP
jgi:hypothetical protein